MGRAIEIPEGFVNNIVQTKEIPIEYVVDLDLPNIKRRKASAGFDITCPFCKGRYKLHINPNKGFARCAKCGDGNNPEKGFNSIKLHAKLTGKSTKEAYEDLMSKWTGKPQKTKTKYDVEKDENQNIIMPIDLLNKFNVNVINKLQITNKHINNLIERGLDKPTIKANGYRSLRTLTTKEITSFFNPRGIKKNWGVPGFYDLSTSPKMVDVTNTGILIPVVDIDGNITSFQIRHDSGETRYSWLSSTYVKTGVSLTGNNNIHHVGFIKNKKYNRVYLTEGALKADVASFLSKKPFIGITGVSNTKQLSDDLNKLRLKYSTNEIVVCIDMDYRDKKEVAVALKRICQIIKDENIKCKIATWDINYKGIDDYLLAYNKNITNKKIIICNAID